MGLGARSEKLTIKGYEETSRGDGTALDVFTVVMVTWIYTFVKIHHTVHLNVCILLYVNYTSIKLIFRKLQTHKLILL